MGVSTHGATPKWMVYEGNPTQMDDLGYFRNPPYVPTKKHQICR